MEYITPRISRTLLGEALHTNADVADEACRRVGIPLLPTGTGYKATGYNADAIRAHDSELEMAVAAIKSELRRTRSAPEVLPDTGRSGELASIKEYVTSAIELLQTISARVSALEYETTGQQSLPLGQE